MYAAAIPGARPVPGDHLFHAQRRSCCPRMTDIEIFACRVFDQDWDEVAYRPTVEHVVATPARDPALLRRLAFSTGR
jgi:hypothetical protein